MLSLNHSNANLRSNALDFILNKLNSAAPTLIDDNFVSEQLKIKFATESSPQVLESLLKFDIKLTNYLSVQELIENENYLLKLFKPEVISTEVDLNDESSEMHEFINEQHSNWLNCRSQAIDLIFSHLYAKHADIKDSFFNCFLLVLNQLLQMKSIQLLNHLKKTKFYLDIQQDSQHESEGKKSNTPVKKFYSCSSISLTKITTGVVQSTRVLNGSAKHQTDTDIEENDLFDHFVQVAVKFMLANKDAEPPKCFQVSGGQQPLQLLDLIVFEIAARLCAQSLFLTNAAVYLNICTQTLMKLFEKPVKQVKKTSESVRFEEIFLKSDTAGPLNGNSSPKRGSTNLTNYLHLVKKPGVSHAQLAVDLYQTLFKSIGIQMSNFVNLNAKLEIEKILNKLYAHICLVSSSGGGGEKSVEFIQVLKKFTQASFFNSLAYSSTVSAPYTPTKISAINNSNISNSFLQFAFKFLIHSERDGAEMALLNEPFASVSTQTRTLQLFGIYLNDLLDNFAKSNESSLCNALVLSATWCLTSPNDSVRGEALRLLDKCHSMNVASPVDSFKWQTLIKKLTKHREEIEIDGAAYVSSKCLGKLFVAESSDSLFAIIEQFLRASSDKSGGSFFSNYLNEPHALLTLNKFKYCLLDLFKQLKDESKLKLLPPLMSMFLSICNYDLDENAAPNLVCLFENQVRLITGNYLVTSKSSQYFIENEKYFDYLIGYLNRNDSSTHTAMHRILTVFNETFLNRLANGGNTVAQFFQQLGAKLQADLVKCCFDIWLSLSISSHVSAGLIKQCLHTLEPGSSHLLVVLHERVNLQESTTAAADTTKQMKKQLKQQLTESSLVALNWKCLKHVLEFLQYSFSQHENKMETDDSTDHPNMFIELIPYLFLVLETVEATMGMQVEMTTEETENDLFQYLEVMALNCLLSIYRFNIAANKSLLTDSQFNIELLMQILQTNRGGEQGCDNLNVQEHVLLLLSEIAAIFPDKVLEHVLIMFVFVGTKLARKDDSFSFQIINKIIQTILPSIVNSINSSNEHVKDLANYNNDGGRLKQTVNVVQRHQKQLPYVSSLVCKILQSFVVALPHIPAHRKAVIFNQLLQIIGLDNYLWITIIQSIDYYLVQSIDLLDFTNSLAEITSKQQQNLDDKNEKRLRDTLKTTCLQSMISLHVQFAPKQVLQTSVYLVGFLNKYLTSLFDTAFKLITANNTANINSATVSNLNLPTNKIQNKQIYSHLACQLDNYNILQMKYLAYNLLTFVSDLIMSEELLVKLAMSKGEEPAAELFQNLLEKILLLILKLSQVFTAFEQHGATIKAPNQQLAVINDLRKFHKAIVNKSYDLMERAISLLDSKQFIAAIQRLIKHDLLQIRRRVLGLLNNKLRKYEPTAEETTLLIALLEDLLASMEIGAHTDQLEVEINNQTILFSIKLLCKRIGEQNPLAFVKVIKFVCQNLIQTSMYLNAADSNINNINLLSSVLLCVGELCLKLKSTALIYLNQIMNFTLEIVDVIRKRTGCFDEQLPASTDIDVLYLSEQSAAAQTVPAINKNYELLILSCVTCTLKIVQNMASFISPFLPRILYVSCSLSNLIASSTSAEHAAESNSNYPQIKLRLGQLRASVATLIPLRLLAPILNEHSAFSTESPKTSYRMTVKNIEFYMQMTAAAIRNVSQEDLLANIRLLRSMFMNLFDLRSVLMQKLAAAGKHDDESFATTVCRYEDFVIDAFCELIFKLSEDLFKPIFFKLYEWATVNEPAKDRLITFYRTTLK